MSLDDVIQDPPSASELAWLADRLTLGDLPRDQQEWFETLSTEIHRAWPSAEAIVEEQQEADNALWVRLEGELAELGVPIELSDDNGTDEIVDAVKAALEQAREEGVKDATIPSRANTAQRKAMRLLVEGRVEISRREDRGEHRGLVVASVKGDSGEVYACGFDPHRRQWRCTCQEMRGQCSHLLAVKMIAPTLREDAAP